MMPSEMYWRGHYEESCARAEAATEDARARSEAVKIRFADVGCGFGGLLVRLSGVFPNKVMLGMEIRDKVS